MCKVPPLERGFFPLPSYHSIQIAYVTIPVCGEKENRFENARQIDFESYPLVN